MLISIWMQTKCRSRCLVAWVCMNEMVRERHAPCRGKTSRYSRTQPWVGTQPLTLLSTFISSCISLSSSASTMKHHALLSYIDSLTCFPSTFRVQDLTTTDNFRYCPTLITYMHAPLSHTPLPWVSQWAKERGNTKCEQNRRTICWSAQWVRACIIDIMRTTIDRMSVHRHGNDECRRAIAQCNFGHHERVHVCARCIKCIKSACVCHFIDRKTHTCNDLHKGEKNNSFSSHYCCSVCSYQEKWVKFTNRGYFNQNKAEINSENMLATIPLDTQVRERGETK